VEPHLPLRTGGVLEAAEVEGRAWRGRRHDH
jgi:hypothetical protein